MRDLKFRTWNRRDRHMTEDALRLNSDGTVSFQSITPPGAHATLKEGEIEWMQFTGLKDKNGVEVYEGNVVAVFDGEEQTGLYEVEYCGDRNYPAFDFKGWDGETNGICEAKEAFELQVIGDIYRNPELLVPKVATQIKV